MFFHCCDDTFLTDMNRQEAVDLLQKCIDEVHTRFIVNQGSYQVRVVDKDGAHDLPNLTPKMISNVVPSKPASVVSSPRQSIAVKKWTWPTQKLFW